jgi:alkaline phosphatase
MRFPSRWPVVTAGVALAVSGAAVGEEVPQVDDAWFAAGQRSLKEAQAEQETTRARNVILFIGDGMSVATVTAARIHEGQLRGETGEENFLSFETMPYSALAKTYSTDMQVADSAGTATAMLSGVKTRSGFLGVGSRAERGDCESARVSSIVTALELAESIGLSTGVVSTARITHATPAAGYAHVPERGWESDKALPEEAVAAGCIDIARQLVEFPHGDGVDVALGGGRLFFLPESASDPEEEGRTGLRADGRDLTADWVARGEGARYIWNLAQLEALELASTGPLLGLFEGSHMEFEADRSEDAGGEPSLSVMTGTAIDIVSRNKKGYFLLIEAGRIDHAHHGGNAYRALTDTIEYARAVQVAMDKTSSTDTLIIVTADHSHTLTMAGYPVRGNPILGKVVRSNGDLALGSDELPYTTLGYGNGPGSWRGERPDLTEVDTTETDYRQWAAVPMGSETHGGEDVPVYAQGPGAQWIRGVVEQHYLFHVMDAALRLTARAK